jgi:hypothetical protein
MPTPVYQIGRLGKVYAKAESTYGTAPTFSATNALRHLNIKTHASLNRSDSLEKRGTPGLRDRFSRHIDGSVDLEAYLQPSGTIQTAPEAAAILKNAFGTEVIGAGSTTIASSPTTTGATLTAGTGFVVGEMISISIASGPNAGVYARKLTALAGAAATWAPALPGAPSVADTVKSMCSYQLANELPSGLTIAHYLPNLTVEMHGWVINKLTVQFDGNDEAKFRAQGPAKERLRPAQSVPGSFTTVGSPVTGIIGTLLFNGTAYQVTKGQFDIENMEALMNDIFGTDRSQGFYRNGRRKVSFSLEAYVSDDTSVIAQAETASDNTLFVQVGTTEGKVIGIYCPRVEFDVPDTPDGDGAIKWSFTGVAKETSGNDEIVLGI